DWIQEMITLWQSGKREEAMMMLQAFQEKYPDYPVTELKQQLPAGLMELN
ncbi:MAG: hypothetical protein GWN00_36710, partial [Aliifodinibius sp.]|nr:hypothetical protein [Fodinibius sp.]NIY30127.1 hypothetical protein [Fodinibius sp.]